MEHEHIRLSSLLLMILLTAPGETEVYYVHNDTTASCPFSPCDSLDNYVSNRLDIFTSGVTMLILPGEHTLTQRMNIVNVSNFAFIQSTAESNVTILCQNGNVVVRSSRNVTIGGVSFVGCGIEDDFNIAAVHFENNVHLIINSILVRDSVYRGVALKNTFGQSSVTNIAIQQDRSRGTSAFELSYQAYDANPPGILPLASNNLLLDGCRLSEAASMVVSLRFTGYSLNVDITNLTILGIHDVSRGPLYINTLTPEVATLTIRNSRIVDSDYIGVHVFDQGSPQAIIGFDNCEISRHRAGGAYLQFYQPQPTTPTLAVVMQSTVVINNNFFVTSGTIRGAAMTVEYRGDSGLEYMQRPVVFRNVSFLENRFRAIIGERPSTVYLSRTYNVTFLDCSFTGNQATALLAYLSIFTVAGNLTMAYNFAFQGGAVALFGASYMVVENNTNILFDSNAASDVGGAIFVDNYYTPFLTPTSSCFLQIPGLDNLAVDTSDLNITLNFTGNRAESGGNAIYGAQLHDCTISAVYYGYQLLTGDLPFADFHPDVHTDVTVVTSAPQHVCICTDETPDCFSIFYNESRHPGEAFTISAAIVGDNFGTVIGSVFARFLPMEGQAQSSLSNLQATQLVTQQRCVDLQYTVRSSNALEVLTLTATGAPVLEYGDPTVVKLAREIYSSNGRILDDLLASPVYINVTLLPCPLGFVLDENSECSCDPTLVENDITCNISDQTVSRNGTIWVGVSYSGNTSNGVIVYLYCPYAYCRDKRQNVNLEYPNTQCVRNHAGTLCGACESSLSLTLGGSQCRRCSNSYLVLLLPFALAGVVLVLFIKFLNLTVTEGTINGLIFYANVIQASSYSGIFFPRENASVFIAWLNLDLGIETCFFDGLDGYSKIWLQFVFPVYVWLIALLIIFASSRSMTASKIFGENSVPMLATLFHLSYAKLLRTIITSLSFTLLDYPDGSTTVVWTFDGNVEYLKGKHVPLFLFSVLVLVLVWLPYTVLLFSSQWLTKVPSRRLARWYTRVKPFLDAYCGPFKDKHRYWVGALLLARCVLFLVFAINPSSTPSVDLLVIIIIVSLLLTYTSTVCGLYRKCYNTWLENSFFLNLLLLSAGSLYIESASEGDLQTLSYVSAAIAFAEFLLIVGLHSYSYLHGRRVWLKLRQGVGRRGGYVSAESEKDEVRSKNRYTHQSISLGQLREPMLDSVTD